MLKTLVLIAIIVPPCRVAQATPVRADAAAALAPVSCPDTATAGAAPIPGLSDAAFAGDFAKVRSVLAKYPGALNQRDENLKTPLMNALSAYIAEPSSRSGPSPMPKSERAREIRKFRIASLLLKNGASAQCRDVHGMTALHLAVFASGDDSQLLVVARALLRQGALVDAATTDTHVTPLMLAFSNRREALARLLIAAGADVHARSTVGESVETLAERAGMQGILKSKAEARTQR